ncbi:FGGY family carbohydrate kinase [Kaarinaea lacus]
MDDKPLYLAIDQGGGSTRAIVFNVDANVVASASQNIAVEHPRLGWVEQDAQEIASSAKNVLREIEYQLGSQVSQIAAVGLATQRSNVVCWRKSDGKPLSPAISWQDRRAYQWMRRFDNQLEMIRQKTGLVVSPHYGVSKIKWCLDHIEEVTKANSSADLICGPLASFLVSQLVDSPGALVDPANASRTLLWNIHTGQWDDELLALFELDKGYLPDCMPTYHHYGNIELGGRAIPLTVVTGDQSAALYAYGKPQQGTVFINMGTGVFIQYPTDNQIVDIPGLLCSMVYRDVSNSEYVIESTINGASNALMEIEDALGVPGDEAEKNLAAWFERYPNPPLFLNGVAGLAAPYWVPDFASRFIGEGTPEEKILAVAESILFLIKVNIRLMVENYQPISVVRVTGGLSNSDCLCQKLANLLQLPVIRSEQTEATAMGLAFLTAQSPDSWHLPANGKSFAVEEEFSLHKRFNAWEVEMTRALKK